MGKTLSEFAESYFQAFSQKNIQKLREMFDDNITLRDWEINETGIEDVLRANANIFESVKTIEVIHQNIISENNTIAAELKIVINGVENLKVVDLIEFNGNGKILSIKAFKG